MKYPERGTWQWLVAEIIIRGSAFTLGWFLGAALFKACQ